MTKLLNQKIEKIVPFLQATARGMSNGDNTLADDLVQSAAVRLLTTCDDDTPEKIMWWRGHSAMLHTIRANNTYNRIVAEESAVTQYVDLGHDGLDPDGDDLGISWEGYASPNQMTPEDQMIQSEELNAIFAAVEQLTQENQRIVKALAIGKRPVEIASDLGVSRAAMTQRITRIAEKLENFGIFQA